jgi:hypothetical protein
MGHKQRVRAGRREALAMDDEPDNLEDGGIVIDDADTSVAAGSDSPPPPAAATEDEPDEPLDVLKRQFEELKAEKEAEERRRAAAEQRAREYEARTREQAAKLDQHAASVLAQQKSAIEHGYASEDLKLKDAQRRLAQAEEAGDANAKAQATLEMIQADRVMREYTAVYQDIERREKAPKPVPKPEPVLSQDEQFEAQLKQMHPKVADWAREHKADMFDPVKRKLAEAADRMADAMGFPPGSEQYMQYLDRKMGYAKPAATSATPATDSVNESGTASPRTAMRAPAAPPSRTASSGGKLRVHLSAEDKQWARRYNVSEEEYAKWKVRSDKTADTVSDPRRLQLKVYAE